MSESTLAIRPMWPHHHQGLLESDLILQRDHWCSLRVIHVKLFMALLGHTIHPQLENFAYCTSDSIGEHMEAKHDTQIVDGESTLQRELRATQHVSKKSLYGPSHFSPGTFGPCHLTLKADVMLHVATLMLCALRIVLGRAALVPAPHARPCAARHNALSSPDRVGAVCFSSALECGASPLIAGCLRALECPCAALLVAQCGRIVLHAFITLFIPTSLHSFQKHPNTPKSIEF
ncbi:hypothetical protein HAX54_016170 [Datura stramonium]|uniref:Uncharacterized protein n=1 Tax=Datura stramonium TaxID=4076 RepID=A0ABS8UJN2_DATST|nr:hypothetical protein [Datura stramonium]